jgi:hypothetical protein
MASADKGPWFSKNLEYVLSYSATLREPEVIGPLPEGLRLNFYITGGTFEGPNCKGTLLPVGADWLTIRTDGIGILDALAIPSRCRRSGKSQPSGERERDRLSFRY